MNRRIRCILIVGGLLVGCTSASNEDIGATESDLTLGPLTIRSAPLPAPTILSETDNWYKQSWYPFKDGTSGISASEQHVVIVPNIASSPAGIAHELRVTSALFPLGDGDAYAFMSKDTLCIARRSDPSTIEKHSLEYGGTLIPFSKNILWYFIYGTKPGEYSMGKGLTKISYDADTVTVTPRYVDFNGYFPNWGGAPSVHSPDGGHNLYFTDGALANTYSLYRVDDDATVRPQLVVSLTGNGAGYPFLNQAFSIGDRLVQSLSPVPGFGVYAGPNFTRYDGVPGPGENSEIFVNDAESIYGTTGTTSDFSRGFVVPHAASNAVYFRTDSGFRYLFEPIGFMTPITPPSDGYVSVRNDSATLTPNVSYLGMGPTNSLWYGSDAPGLREAGLLEMGSEVRTPFFRGRLVYTALSKNGRYSWLVFVGPLLRGSSFLTSSERDFTVVLWDNESREVVASTPYHIVGPLPEERFGAGGIRRVVVYPSMYNEDGAIVRVSFSNQIIGPYGETTARAVAVDYWQSRGAPSISLSGCQRDNYSPYASLSIASSISNGDWRPIELPNDILVSGVGTPCPGLYRIRKGGGRSTPPVALGVDAEYLGSLNSNFVFYRTPDDPNLAKVFRLEPPAQLGSFAMDAVDTTAAFATPSRTGIVFATKNALITATSAP